MGDEDDIRAAHRAFVRSAMDATGLLPSQLAKRAGVDPSTLTRFVNSPEHKTNLSATTLTKIAAVSGVRAPLPERALPSRERLAKVRVKGVAAAGLWRDVAVMENTALETIPVLEDERFAGREQYALRIEGTSLNRKIKDGWYGIFVSWDGIGRPPQNGEYVHVERNRGGLQEVTVKRVRIINGQVELWPDSDDPRWQKPLTLSHADDDTEVVIRGLLIGIYQHA